MQYCANRTLVQRTVVTNGLVGIDKIAYVRYNASVPSDR